MADRIIEKTERTEKEVPRETVVVHDREPERRGSNAWVIVAVIVLVIILLLIFGHGLIGGGGGGTSPTPSAPTTTTGQ